MQRKLAGYVLLSFLSFSVATTLFLTVANAQTIERGPATEVPNVTPVPPTPTTPPVKFILKSVTIPTPTVVPTAIPKAIPAPRPAVAAPADLEPFFDKYAGEYAIDKEDLKRIAKCEAGFNSQSDTGLYAGMYQFAAQTWTSTRNTMGMDPNPDLRKNAEESIRTAAFKIKIGGRGAWPNC